MLGGRAASSGEELLSTIVLAFAFLCLEVVMLAEARHVLPSPGSPAILTAMTLAMSCSCLLFVKWRGLLSIVHPPLFKFISCLVPIVAAASGGLALLGKLGHVLSTIALAFASVIF